MEVNEKKTKMVAEQKVKIKLMRDAVISGEIQTAGGVFEVSESEAKELCEPILGTYSHSGYRLQENAHRHEIRRAVRI